MRKFEENVPFSYEQTSLWEQFVDDLLAFEKNKDTVFVTKANSWVSISFPEEDIDLAIRVETMLSHYVDIDKLEVERDNPEPGDILYYIDKHRIEK